LLAGYLAETYGVQIGFAQWMLLGIPIVAVGLPLGWFLLTRVIYPVGKTRIPGGREEIRSELSALGPLTMGERRVAVVFCLAALGWIFRPTLERWIPGLSDPGISIAAGISLFFLPADRERRRFVLEWSDARGLPWDVLILFGGGLSLAAAISQSGLATWIGISLEGLQILPTIAVMFGITLVVIFLTELTSNTATAAAFLPVIGSLALGLGENPLLLTAPAALGATCAFMLPVGTPPNAIVYGTGQVTIRQMARAGLYFNLLFSLLITLLCYSLMGLVFGVEIGTLPDWAR
jgi:sodium-dependent dicarboxylate transporter 2/3/5